MQDKIIIKGAREHNLKNINLELPRNKMIVFTGLSGSGKSSLAFDTIFAEGQRRYVESLSAVEYMSSRFGRPAIRNLLDLMAQNYNFENSFRTVLLETVSDFEAAWQRDLTQ